MKKRVTYVLLAFLLASLVVLFSGCFSRVKNLDKISGPTWVTSLTMPLVTRMMEKDENGVLRSHSEIRLGKGQNGIGEDGLDLAGQTLHSYKADPLEWRETLATVEVELGQIAAISLTNPGSGAIKISPSNPGVPVDLTGADADVVEVRLSNKYQEKDHNDIAIELTGGQAGPGGLSFILRRNNEDGYSEMKL